MNWRVSMTTKRITSDAETVLEEIENRSQRMFWPIIGPLKGKYLKGEVPTNDSRLRPKYMKPRSPYSAQVRLK